MFWVWPVTNQQRIMEIYLIVSLPQGKMRKLCTMSGQRQIKLTFKTLMILLSSKWTDLVNINHNIWGLFMRITLEKFELTRAIIE